MRAVVAAVALAGAGFAWQARPRETHRPYWVRAILPETLETRPNVVFVVYDARRQDDFSFGPFGNRRRDTPFLARFKDDALYFAGAVSPGCWTVPVHASMFTGLSVCELGNDLYSRGFQAFPTGVKTLAEILQLSGYRTYAFPDHPYFYAGSAERSLVRGFELFSVVNGHGRLGLLNNMSGDGREVRIDYPLDPIGKKHDLDPAELASEVERFNRGEIRFDLDDEADHDPERGLYLAPLEDLFKASPYFQIRYGQAFDRLLGSGHRRPFFLFLNLHMCTLFYADQPLYSRWLLRTLMMTAQSRGAALKPPRPGEPASSVLKRNYAALALPVDVMSEYGLLKQIFDNRFYDAVFQSVWEYLEQHRLTGNTVTVVASDHGMSFGEQGETRYLHQGALPNEYITRVPLVMRFPEGSPLRRFHGRNDHAVSLTDLFPTLVELGVGKDVYRRPEPIRGMSLLDRVRHDRYEPVVVSECALRPETYASAYLRAAYVKAFYEGPLKLVYAPELFKITRKDVAFTDSLSGAHRFRTNQAIEQLYDLGADPRERTNLAARHPDVVARLKASRPEPWSCGLTMADPAPEWDADARDTLRALGYVN